MNPASTAVALLACCAANAWGQSPPPAQVTAIGPLDLDDARAEVLQAQRRIGPAQELAQIDDQKAREWKVVRHVSVLPSQSAGLRYFTVCRCSQ